jgi:hypothetical protein
MEEVDMYSKISKLCVVGSDLGAKSTDWWHSPPGRMSYCVHFNECPMSGDLYMPWLQKDSTKKDMLALRKNSKQRNLHQPCLCDLQP